MYSALVRNPYNYDVDEASFESGVRCEDVSLAQQSGKDESDINTIVKRFGLTGQLPSGVRAPQYGDFQGIGSYHEALNQVIAANEAFAKMPAYIRARFHNDPGLFVDFTSKIENWEEAQKMGLLVPGATKPVAPVASQKPSGSTIGSGDVVPQPNAS